MSLRTRLLLAFAYGFLLIVIALEVPLALNLRRRVDAEVRNDAAGQAHIVAAQASGSMNRPAQLRRIANQAATAPAHAFERCSIFELLARRHTLASHEQQLPHLPPVRDRVPRDFEPPRCPRGRVERPPTLRSPRGDMPSARPP